MNASSFGGELSVRRQHAALGEVGDVGRPLLVVVVTPDRHELARRAATRGVDHVRLASGHAGGGQHSDVAVAAVFPEQCCGVPQHTEGLVGPRQCGVGGEQRPTLRWRRLSRPASEVGGLGDIGAVEDALQGGDRSVQPGAKGGLRRREVPRVGQRSGNARRGEVVEQRGHHLGPDRSEWSGPPGEVAHPEALVAGLTQGPNGLGTEVGDGVDQFEALPQLPGEGGITGHPGSLPDRPARSPIGLTVEG